MATSENEVEWPILDLSKFPNQMISGLTLDEINAHIDQVENNDSFLADLMSDQSDSQSKQFTSPIADSTLKDNQINSTPRGTVTRNKWAISLYEKWQKQRIVTKGDDENFNLPSKEELKNAEKCVINYWFAKFIYEVRRQDGNRYPRNTLVSMVAGLNAHFLCNGRSLSLFKDEEFNHFREILDLACKESTKDGIGIYQKQAETISESEEELLWSSGALGDDSPTSLINTLLYLNGLHFALRSGNEHRALTVDQISILPPTADCKYYIIEYREKVSKTNQGGLKHRKLNPKYVKHVDLNSVNNPTRSHANLLQKYLRLRPPNCGNEFYLTPLKVSSSCWFKSTPMGHNTLTKVVKSLCDSCGIKGYKTNHSLRATCATRLYENGVDEQLIMERTGHRSTRGVRSYKRTSDIHHYNTSVVLDSRNILSQQQNLSTNNLVRQNNTMNFHFHSGCSVVINNN